MNKEQLIKWENIEPLVDFYFKGFVVGGGDKVSAKIAKEVIKYRLIKKEK